MIVMLIVTALIVGLVVGFHAGKRHAATSATSRDRALWIAACEHEIERRALLTAANVLRGE